MELKLTKFDSLCIIYKYMEFSRSAFSEHIAAVARAVGKGALEAGRTMSSGFAQANDGEAGLRRQAAVMHDDPAAKTVTLQTFEAPDAVPEAWQRKHD